MDVPHGCQSFQFTDPQNVHVQNGNLVIWMRKQDKIAVNNILAASSSGQAFHYGYFEARAKLFEGAGWHESIWAMAVTDGSTTYPPNIRTEIDGLEFDSDTTWKGRMGLIIWQGPSHSQNRSCTAGVGRGPLGIDATTGLSHLWVRIYRAKHQILS